MPGIRTFIALEISSDVQASAQRLIGKLQTAQAVVNWVDPANMHLTLKFLGDVPDTETPAVCQAVARAAADCKPLELEFRTAGAYPHVHKPRTIWLGIGQPPDKPLSALHQRLENELEQLGHPRESRLFTPHLTIGRVRPGGPTMQHLGQLLRENADFQAGRCRIAEVVVFASFLDKAGPTYDVMSRIQL